MPLCLSILIFTVLLSYTTLNVGVRNLLPEHGKVISGLGTIKEIDLSAFLTEVLFCFSFPKQNAVLRLFRYTSYINYLIPSPSPVKKPTSELNKKEIIIKFKNPSHYLYMIDPTKEWQLA